MKARKYICFAPLASAAALPMCTVAQPVADSVDALEALFGKHAGMRRTQSKEPASFRFQVQLAQAEDDPNDPTRAWPDQRRQVTAGHLVIHSLAEASSRELVLFNPLALPDGIEPSADPVLLARPAAYGTSFGRRVAERQ